MGGRVRGGWGGRDKEPSLAGIKRYGWVGRRLGKAGRGREGGCKASKRASKSSLVPPSRPGQVGRVVCVCAYVFVGQ